MAPGTKTEMYAALAAEAESTVAGVKDPDLRRVAFEKILATLIEQNTLPDAAPAGERQQSKADPRAVKGAPKSTALKSASGPKAYVEELIADGFFKQQRSIAEVKAELALQGRHIPLTSLSGPLQRLTQERRLRRQKTPGNGKDARSTYAYSNW